LAVTVLAFTEPKVTEQVVQICCGVESATELPLGLTLISFAVPEIELIAAKPLIERIDPFQERLGVAAQTPPE
jgi:hypothetical protein